MDPVTHVLLGSAVSQIFFSKKLGPKVWVPSALGGLLPDADVFIQSSKDPLLFLEYHRHFTHSLLFIPIGGLMAALPWLLMRRYRSQWKIFVGATTMAYATHGLLDACTTYGTLLYWPFSMARVNWNCISIVDPIFTMILLVGVILAARWRQGKPALMAFLLCLSYLGLGVIQRERSLSVQEQLARLRGHTRVREAVFPTNGNNIVWRSLYKAGDTFYSDGIRVPWFSNPTHASDSFVQALNENSLPPELLANARVRRGFKIFYWFSDGWTAYAPSDPGMIGDMRYALFTYGFEPLWGIRVELTSPDQPVRWVRHRIEWKRGLGTLWLEIAGDDPRYQPVVATENH